MTLNVSKGTDVAVMTLLLTSDKIPGIKEIVGLQTIIALSLLFMLYSIILSSIIARFTNYLLVEGKYKVTNHHKVAAQA